MKIWPFGNKMETRAETSYTDALIGALVNRAQGKTLAIPSATASLEMCASLVGRGFLAAEIAGRESVVDVLVPDLLEMIGRALIRRGEVVYMIDMGSGQLRLLPAASWDVTGGPDPSTWSYRLSLSGPSTTMTYDEVDPERVLHFKYASDPSSPWRGNSPMDIASLAGKLSSETARQLGEESSGSVGRLLSIPKDGDDATISALRKDIQSAAGRVALVEGGDWGDAGGGRMDIKTERFGADPPQGMVNLMDVASREVVSAVGFHPSLFQVGPAASIREAFRLALFAVISPLGRKVERELQAKLDPSISISWAELRASDLVGRARGFQSLVNGGLSIDAAGKEAGLMHIEAAPVVAEAAAPTP